ncbi:RNA-binding protein [Ensifer soli]|uniref:RNA-binding protein n=1 Tax=Ciceribacter sp. sgz301302 TaxID=3342379 RepID=UPI0035B92EE7
MAAPDEADDDGEAGPVNGRTCIVTRESGDPAMLIRFVADPSGKIVCDLKRQLPGRGCWVKAERALVEKAVARKLFNRALKREVTAGPQLAEEVDRLLVLQLTGMMNMARKAGQFVSGAAKTEAAVRGLSAIGVFHASDAAADGVRKIEQARKAVHLGGAMPEEIPVFSPLSAAEMDALLGSNAFIHAAVLAGQAGEGVVKRAIMLDTYRGRPVARANAGSDRPAP